MASPSQIQQPDPDPSSLQPQIENPISNLEEITQHNDHPSPKTLEMTKIQDPERSDPNIEEAQVILDVDEQEDEFSGNVISTTTKIRSRSKVYKRKRPYELKRQQTIDRKVENLLKCVNFVPFMPVKRLDFDKYEGLLKDIGLWDFVRLEFDDEVRADLISQLIVSYDSVKRCAHVNGARINLNRASFVKCMKLPKAKNKKEKVVGSVAEAAIDLDSEVERVSEDCVKFVEDLVWNWVVLHGDDWDMPNEIEVSMGLIKDGNPDKVDWGGLFWVLVDNELKQRDQLRECYYTSHLQYFIKSERREFFEEEGKKFVASEGNKEEGIKFVASEGNKEEGKLLSEEDNKQAEVEEVKSQRMELFEEEGVKVVASEGTNEEDKKEEVVVVEEIQKDEDLLEEPCKVDQKVAEEGDLLSERLHGVEKVKEVPNEAEVGKVKQDTDGSLFELIKEEDNVVLGPNIELTLGQQDVVESEKISGVNMMDVEECKEKKQGDWCLDGSDLGSKPFLRPCIYGEGRGSEGNEEGKQEVEQLQMEEGNQYIEEGKQMEDVEHIQRGYQMEDGEHIQRGGQMEDVEHIQRGGDQMEDVEHIQRGDQMEDVEHIQRDQMEEVEQLQGWERTEEEEADDVDELEVDEVEVDDTDEQLEVEDEDEELQDGMEHDIPYGSPGGAGLPGDLLQAFETAQLASNLQGQQIHENSSMELFASNAETHLMMGGPSTYGNGHKRTIDYEQDTSHLNESKRIRTDGGWDQKTSDFGFCMSQAEQLMEKAKMMYAEKEQAYHQIDMNQQYLLRELQQRDECIESLQRNSNESMQKKDADIYRLERELGLLAELVNGYREALKENRRAFLEYRQRFQLPEEPIYKDAGPGGLVLSVREIEKQRQEQENEDRQKRLMIEQKFTEAFEGYCNKFEVLLNKVQTIDMDRLSPIENEVKVLKELYAAKRSAPEKEDLVPTETVPPSA